VNLLYSRLLNALKLPYVLLMSTYLFPATNCESLISLRSITGFLTARFILRLRMWEENKNHVSRTTLPCYLSTNGPDTSTGFDFNHGPFNSQGEVASNQSVIEVSRNVSAIDELGGDIGPRPIYSSDYPEEPLESASSIALESAGSNKGKNRARRSEDDLGTAEDTGVACVPQLDYQRCERVIHGFPIFSLG
jgi:hypothetical protein